MAKNYGDLIPEDFRMVVETEADLLALGETNLLWLSKYYRKCDEVATKRRRHAEILYDKLSEAKEELEVADAYLSEQERDHLECQVSKFFSQKIEYALMAQESRRKADELFNLSLRTRQRMPILFRLPTYDAGDEVVYFVSGDDLVDQVIYPKRLQSRFLLGKVVKAEDDPTVSSRRVQRVTVSFQYGCRDIIQTNTIRLMKASAYWPASAHPEFFQNYLRAQSRVCERQVQEELISTMLEAACNAQPA